MKRKITASLSNERWISATVNEKYSEDKKEGISKVDEGTTVILYEDEKGNRTWDVS